MRRQRLRRVRVRAVEHDRLAVQRRRQRRGLALARSHRPAADRRASVSIEMSTNACGRRGPPDHIHRPTPAVTTARTSAIHERPKRLLRFRGRATPNYFAYFARFCISAMFASVWCAVRRRAGNRQLGVLPRLVVTGPSASGATPRRAARRARQASAGSPHDTPGTRPRAGPCACRSPAAVSHASIMSGLSASTSRRRAIRRRTCER